MKAAIYNGKKNISIRSIITQEFPLDELALAIETESDTDHALNVLIQYQ